MKSKRKVIPEKLGRRKWHSKEWRIKKMELKKQLKKWKRKNQLKRIYKEKEGILRIILHKETEI